MGRTGGRSGASPVRGRNDRLGRAAGSRSGSRVEPCTVRTVASLSSVDVSDVAAEGDHPITSGEHAISYSCGRGTSVTPAVTTSASAVSGTTRSCGGVGPARQPAVSGLPGDPERLRHRHDLQAGPAAVLQQVALRRARLLNLLGAGAHLRRQLAGLRGGAGPGAAGAGPR